MANEVELKLSLPSIAVPAFKQDGQLGVSTNDVLTLDNQYFDTPDLLLNQAHAAIRIRKSQYGYKQTLKNKGTAIAGLHQRGEWEYDIADANIDWSLFPEEAQIAPSVRAAIAPLFKTDFSRHVWHKKINDSEIELVLDEGLVASQDHNLALCEIELELTKGSVKDIFQFAKELAKQHPLVPCDINKAERGYGLIEPTLSFFQPQDFPAQYAEFTDIDLLPLLQETLTRMSRSWDDFSQKEDWWALVLLSRHICGVHYVLDKLDDCPQPLMDHWQQLRHSLLELLKPATTVVGLQVDGNSHSRGLSQRLLQPLVQQLNHNLSQWIDQNDLGQAMLMLGEFLYEQAQGEQNLSFAQVVLPHIRERLATLDDHSLASMQDIKQLQGLAYLLRRIAHPAYDTLNAYIRQCLVVLAMSECKEHGLTVSDDSQAKLASWVRRLTVEYRQLNESRLALIELANTL